MRVYFESVEYFVPFDQAHLELHPKYYLSHIRPNLGVKVRLILGGINIQHEW